VYEPQPIEKAIGWREQKVKQIKASYQCSMLNVLNSLPQSQGRHGISEEEGKIEKADPKELSGHTNVVDKEISAIDPRQSAIVEQRHSAQTQEMVFYQQLRHDDQGIDSCIICEV
jgi:predicted GNAT family acetyltransferase